MKKKIARPKANKIKEARNNSQADIHKRAISSFAALAALFDHSIR